MKHPYGPASSKRLSTCSESVRRVMTRAAYYLNISILCGHRTEAEQEQAFNDGFSEVHYPHSEHNVYPSNAVDCGIYRDDIENVDYTDTAGFGLLAGVIHACAIEEGCVAIWGHDWDHDFNFKEHSFKDLPHFTILTRDEFDRRKNVKRQHP